MPNRPLSIGFVAALFIACNGERSAGSRGDPSDDDDIAIERDGGACDDACKGSTDGGASVDQQEAACAAKLEENPSLYLMDPDNCGGCGHDCLGGKCSSGTCEPVIVGSSTRTGPVWKERMYAVGLNNDINVFDTSLGDAWTKHGHVSVPPIDPDVEPYQYSSWVTLANVDDSGIYAVSYRSVDEHHEKTGKLHVISLAGGEAEAIADGDIANDVALDASNAYFRMYQPVSDGAREEALYSVPKKGGSPKLIASLGDVPLADGKFSFDEVRELVVSNGYLYVLVWSGGTQLNDTKGIARVPIGGGSLTTVVDAPNPHRLAVTGDDLVWVEGTSTLSLMTKKSGKEKALLTKLPSTVDPESILTDAKSVYFVDPYNKGLQRVDRSTGKVSTLAQYPGEKLTGLVQSDKALYWLVVGDAATHLMRLAK